MRIITLCLIASSAMIFSIGCDTATNSATNTGPDRTSLPDANGPANARTNSNVANTNANAAGDSFMTDAASGGMAEVELGKMASTKAQNAEVKKFAQMMVTDHGKANDELKALAAKKNVTLPTAPIAKHQSVIQKLQGLSGAQFDEAYVEDMVEDHEKDVAEFEKQSQSNPDADVKAFAAKTLPTLKKHLEAIKAIQEKMK
jgi:putative membrane protein